MTRMPWTSDELAKLVDSYRTEAEDGHARLRADFRTHHTQTDDALLLMRDSLNTLRGRVDLIERTPQDVSKLHFSTGVMVSIAFVVASTVGAAYGFGQYVSAKIDAGFLAASKTSDERYTANQKAIDGLERKMELLRYEQQRLREDVTKEKAKP